ncbi:hypothetical protein NE237_013881 [Protea cynaroides]|uniref:Ferredoxin n=1 Tax=Protea cynaroides TaxID=273540 RepID=A0A9Q0H2J3_9MAGN|nr:hypothetical protein NE237_013881 [Protea cynaroides]
MAISSLRRLSSHFYRCSSTSLYFKVVTRSSATSAPISSSPTSSKKVADRIVKLFVIAPDGDKRQIVGLAGHTLLKALTNNGLIDPASHRLEDIDACSAECEVSIAEEWLDRLPARTYDEEYILKRNARTRIFNKHARLGCQVVLAPELEGTRLEFNHNGKKSGSK